MRILVCLLTCVYSSQLSSEINTCRGELSSMEQELQRLRRDTSMNSSQLSYAEETLQKTQGLLEEKNDAGRTLGGLF